jgi:hypothetical protein
MGLTIRPPIAKQIASTRGPRQSTHTKSQIVKPHGRTSSRRQPSNPKGRHQKFREPPIPSSLEKNERDPSGSENAVNKENNGGVDSQSTKAVEMDEEMQVEMEFNKAFEELSDEFSNEEPEGLFNEEL